MTATAVEISVGRPTKYQAAFVDQARKLAFFGATLDDLANFFDVSRETIDTWMNKYPKFLDAVKAGREEADAQVVKSLWKRAMGYSHPAEKIFLNKEGEPVKVPYTEHYPPDTVACIFWLKNRQRQHWRDVHKLEHSGPDGQPLPPQVNLVLIRADAKGD